MSSTAPAWKKILQNSLKENIKKQGTSATYASISTIRPDNTPAVRTVVMRGFVGEHHSEQIDWKSNLLVVITDKRSEKIKEIQQNRNTEICWYMASTQEQFRIRGTIDIIEKNYDQSKLSHLSQFIYKQEGESVKSGGHLAIESFLKQQATTQKEGTFNWQAERLRQFILFGASMRAQMTTGKQKILEISQLDTVTGWFQNNETQDLLEEAFDNFTLLVIKVNSVSHWTLSSGHESILM